MFSRSLIKIKIGKVCTTIGYRKSAFKTRVDAMEAAILHLKRMLEERVPDAPGKEA